ncbi:hypothetical protein HZH68_014996 [Vespula germanica]|uniref:Uncharacterized protein n=1 Tax=Vespula germanica TaxID=30212 RepID=A0A834MRY0_VESGE|nr:hypothetical protein HZH68_014996 [Vespula germanica]
MEHRESELVLLYCSQAIDENNITLVREMAKTSLNKINLIHNTPSGKAEGKKVSENSSSNENFSDLIIKKFEKVLEGKDNVECIEYGLEVNCTSRKDDKNGCVRCDK